MLYVLWFLVYFMATGYVLGGTWISYLVCAGLYIVSLSIAFSPLGEKLLRVFNHVRVVKTKKEKEYLMPLYSEVYQEALKQYPNLPALQGCIIDSLTVNALAVGKHTVAVTRGAVETFSEDELKGIIAHEIAHIAHGDTKKILINTVGNGIFSVLVIIMKSFLTLMDLLIVREQSINKAIRFFVAFVRMLILLCLFLFVFVGNVILSLNSRKNEYRADRFALQIGYGEELTEALYLLQKMSLGENMKLVEKIQSGHPHIADRIAELEFYLDRPELIRPHSEPSALSE